MESSNLLAAVDLGSNSFHMVICEADQDGTLKVIDKEKEMVRLRGGLDRFGRLDPIVEERAYECLKRFGDRLRHFKAENVRVAGTNTIRNLRPSDEFIGEGSKLLGHKIEVISGREEARLVYLGVSHTLSNDHGKQLVIDIGGGSTEFIIGTRFIASSTKRFFADGLFSEEVWNKAVIGLRLEILPIQAAFSKENWLRATGSSGTIKTTHKIIIALGLEPFGITLNALYSIRDRMIEAGSTENLDLPGLSQDRTPVFAGGLAVLIAAFEALKIDHMTVSDGALTRVMERSIDLFDQIVDDWGLPEDSRELLAWASLLHEIGLSITHNKHHFQGAYILKYAFMPGFSRREQIWLAILVKNHRLSVLLHRRRDSQRFNVKISVKESKIELSLPNEFEGQALLKADLLREKNWLTKIGYELSYF